MEMKVTTSNPLKWHGGKTYMAERIINLMPPRIKNPNNPAADDPGWLHYVEPYAGGLAVLFAQDPEGISEVVNDLNGGLTNFWKCLKLDAEFERFTRLVETTPLSSVEFNATTYRTKRSRDERTSVNDAADFFIRYRQSRQGLGKDFATMTRNRVRRGMNEQASAWLSAVEGLPEAHARLKRVVIFNDDACKVIKQQDGPRTLFYCDPPYMHETRVTTGDYECEMTPEQHSVLLETLGGIEGRFILSGYPSNLYETAESRFGWRHVDIEIDNKASSKAEKEKKIERLWMNY
jgi:DNA adenine methylase